MSFYFAAVKRFKFAILFSFLAGITLVLLNYLKFDIILIDQFNILLCTIFFRFFVIGIPLMISFSLINEAYSQSLFLKYKFLIFFVILCAHLTYSFHLCFSVKNLLIFNQYYYSLIVFLTIIISIIGFLNKSVEKFWKFNNVLFVKLTQVLTYYVGTCAFFTIAIYYISSFSGINVTFEIYKNIYFLFFFFFFNPLLIIKIPRIDQLSETINYPEFYQFLSRYYFVPIAIILIFICYIMIGYFFIQNQMPSLLSYLFVFVSIIFYFFSVIQQEATQKMVRGVIYTKIKKLGYWLVFCLITIYLTFLINQLLLSVLNEFWILLLFLFIAGGIIGIYFILSAKANIKIIPTVLSVILSLTLIGPLMPIHICTNLSVYHLNQLFVEENILLENRKVNFSQLSNLSETNREQLTNIIYFLSERGLLTKLKPFYNQDVDLTSKSFEMVLHDFKVSQ